MLCTMLLPGIYYEEEEEVVTIFIMTDDRQTAESQIVRA